MNVTNSSAIQLNVSQDVDEDMDVDAQDLHANKKKTGSRKWCCVEYSNELKSSKFLLIFQTFYLY